MTDEYSAPNPPRLITARSILLTMIVLVLALVMAWASVVLRRTRLEKTEEFLGTTAIHAIQAGPIVSMEYRGSPNPQDGGKPSEDSATPETQKQTVPQQTTELSGTPGLGMFRRGLLDERHYDWKTLRDGSIEEITDPAREIVILHFSDDPRLLPPENARAEVVPTTIMLELNQGWMGMPGLGKIVRLTDRARPAIRNFVVTRKDIRSSPSK